MLGYNLKMTEAQAAFGLAQLDKLDRFVFRRQKNHRRLTEYFKQYKDWFVLPDSIKSTAWLAYALTIKRQAPFTRYDFLQHLDKNNVQVRVLFSGNITRHPAYRFHKDRYKIASDLHNSDLVMGAGLLIGCHHGMDAREVKRLINICEDFLCKQR